MLTASLFRAFEALSFADTDESITISFDEWKVALQRLGFALNEHDAHALFQTCSRGHLGLMFGEFCAWCACIPFTARHRNAHTARRYVSSQLESVATSKLGPLNLPSRKPERVPPQSSTSPGSQQPKPRSSSAENPRASGSREGGERAHKKVREKEAMQGTDRDKLQSIYSAAPRNKHQSVWTKENLLRGSKKTQEVELAKETRASVSHEIRQVHLLAL